RELYHYQMKLASIDNLRKDGKFLDTDGSIPEGQGVVMALLNECYDILFEMKAEVEEEA
ncbi:6780_t:CDS:1, partial [Racocetra fulgida]